MLGEEEGKKKGRGVTISDRGRGKTIPVDEDLYRTIGKIASSKGVSSGEIVKDALLSTEKTGDIVGAAREHERVEYYESKSAEHKTERLRRLKEIRDLEKRLESGETLTDEDVKRVLKLPQGGGDEDIDKWFNRIIRLKEVEALAAVAGGGSNKGSGESDTTTQLMNTLLGKIIENQFSGGAGSAGGSSGVMNPQLDALADEVERLHDTVTSLGQTSPLAEIEDAMDKVFGFYTKLDELKEKGEGLGFMPKKLEEELDRKTLGKFGRFMGATKEFVDVADKALSVAKKASGEGSAVGNLSPPTD